MIYTNVEVDRQSWTETTTAPNGSSRGIDHWTKITYRQTWADAEENGNYAGRQYKIAKYMINGTVARTTSDPWTE